MALIEVISKETFLKDVEHTCLCHKKQFSSLPPIAPSSAPTISEKSHPSSGKSGIFKFFKGLFSICQSNKQSMDVFCEGKEVLLEN
jgi:hypothetical protein